MSGEITNPLQSLINQAALVKPRCKTVQQYAHRLNPKKASGTLLLLDISGSMGEFVGSWRKIDLLRLALNRPLHPGERVIAFHSIATEINSLQAIPAPEGGTAMHLAIAQACALHPTHTLVVSDGRPDDEMQTITAAKKLTGTISTLYIGSDSDTTAIKFMRELARLGCGRAESCDLRREKNWQILPTAIEQLRLPEIR